MSLSTRFKLMSKSRTSNSTLVLVIGTLRSAAQLQRSMAFLRGLFILTAKDPDSMIDRSVFLIRKQQSSGHGLKFVGFSSCGKGRTVEEHRVNSKDFDVVEKEGGGFQAAHGFF